MVLRILRDLKRCQRELSHNQKTETIFLKAFNLRKEQSLLLEATSEFKKFFMVLSDVQLFCE